MLCGYTIFSLSWAFNFIIRSSSSVTTRVLWCSAEIQFRMKHIEIHMHYIQDLVHKGIIDLQFFPSTEQMTNIFTKTFTEQKFHSLGSRVGVKDTISYKLSVLLSIYIVIWGGGVGSHEFFPLSSLYFSVAFVFGYLTWPRFQDPFFIFTIVMFRGGVGDTSHTPRIYFS